MTTDAGGAPLLSILVPAYAYAEGVERILRALAPWPADVEVLIFDDSADLEVADLAKGWAGEASGLRYRHNSSALGHQLGAAANWNALLEAARGQYCLLMHHDEMPMGRHFLDELRAILTAKRAPEIILLDVLLLDQTLRPLRYHLPSWVRWAVVTHAAGYLFRRNVIGPTGALVVRRERFPRFDPTLRWLVDVELYVRLCRQGLHWQRGRGLEIGSVARTNGTITATLRDTLRQIDTVERGVLRGRYPRDAIWLGSPLGGPLRAVEQTLWMVLRAVQHAWPAVVPLRWRRADDDPC